MAKVDDKYGVTFSMTVTDGEGEEIMDSSTAFNGVNYAQLAPMEDAYVHGLMSKLVDLGYGEAGERDAAQVPGLQAAKADIRGG